MTMPVGDASPQRTTSKRLGGATIIVVALAGIYVLSQFFRNSLGVIGPNLSREFDLDAARLGFLSSIFFLSFAAAQIPLGIAIDRWGPKPAMLVTAALMIGSTILFARAGDFPQLAAARLLMGFGCCSFLMAPLALYAELFEPRKFSTITGIHLGGGSLGMLAATAPLAFVAGAVGWRNAFLGAAAFAAVMAVAVALLVHEAPEVLARRRARVESMRDTLAGVLAATRVRGFWRLFLLQGAGYAAFAAMLGLWVGPWLSQVYGLSLAERGNLTLVMAVAQIAGLFIWGASDRLFGSYRTPVLLGVGMTLASLALAAIVPLPLAALPFFLAVYGFALGVSPVSTAHGKSLFPRELTGRGMTLLNTGVMGMAFAQQVLTGFAIEAFGFAVVDSARVYPPEAFRLVFALLGLQLAVAAFFYWGAPDTHPSREET